MATKKHTTKKHATKKHSVEKKHNTKKHTAVKHADKMEGWCPKCKKMMKMVEAKEVPMKGRGGVTRKRLAGKDEHGHNVSRIL